MAEQFETRLCDRIRRAHQCKSWIGCEEFAARCNNLSIKTVKLWATGCVPIPPNSIGDLARYLDVSEDWLRTGKNEAPSPNLIEACSKNPYMHPDEVTRLMAGFFGDLRPPTAQQIARGKKNSRKN